MTVGLAGIKALKMLAIENTNRDKIMTYSAAHNMGMIVKQGIKCQNCTHNKAIQYSKGILFCWHCKVKTILKGIDNAN